MTNQTLKTELDKLNDVIRNAENSGIEAGRALAKVEAERIFITAEFRDFEHYLTAVHGYSLAYAKLLIKAAQTHDGLITYANVYDRDKDLVPSLEGHLRHLAKLDAEQAFELLEKLAKDHEGRLTVTVIEKAVREHPSQNKGDNTKRAGSPKLTTKERYEQAEERLNRALEKTKELEMAFRFGADPDTLGQVLKELRESFNTQK